MAMTNDLVLTIVQLPLSVSVTLTIALSVIVPWLLVRLVRRYFPYPFFKEDNELVGFTYAVYGLIYGVLLAFTIIVGWEHFATTEALVMHETTVLSELWRDSQAFTPPVRDSIHANLLAYAQSVVDDEWPSMAATGRAAPQTQAYYEALWALAYQDEPAMEYQSAYLSEFLARMNDLSGARRLRILYSRTEVHSVLWLVLLIGAVPAVGYVLLFAGKHAWTQILVMSSIMTIVLLGLLVTVSLQLPFSGTVSVQPDAFRELLESFHQRMAQP